MQVAPMMAGAQQQAPGMPMMAWRNLTARLSADEKGVYLLHDDQLTIYRLWREDSPCLGMRPIRSAA